jgi:1-aminocyclopropane-1-carboxylate deaminase
VLSYEPIIQTIVLGGTRADVLRLDLIDPLISGNKWFKLKYNLEEARKMDVPLLTFGGPFSNHIAATAAAGKMFSIPTIGIIRGEEPKKKSSTLRTAEQNGMKLVFVSREDYRKKNELLFKDQLQQKFGSCLIVPEGGKNLLGVKGSGEILKKEWNYDYILCACGTGTTFAGLCSALNKNTLLIGISVLKGNNSLVDEVNVLLEETKTGCELVGGNEGMDHEILERSFITDKFAFNGYAKVEAQLILFKDQFEKEQNIPLDHVYTTKLFYAFRALAIKNKFRAGSKILLIHSGGLQSNGDFELQNLALLNKLRS